MTDPSAPRVPTQARAQRTRRRLLVAAEQEFSARGYAGATAKSIAAAAGVSTGSFYQYFRDKDAALRELAIDRFERVATQVGAILAAPDAHSRARARSAMARVVQAVVAYHQEDPALHAVISERRVHDGQMAQRIEAGESELIVVLERLLGHWGFEGDAEARAFLIFHTVEGAVHAHCLGHARVDDARLVQTMVGALAAMAGVLDEPPADDESAA